MIGRPVVVLLLLALAPAAPATAQEDTISTPVDSVIVTPTAPLTIGEAPDTALRLPITPRAAFIRSMVLPGWGQATFGSWVRGGVFFAGWAANWYMNVRNYRRLYDARDRRSLREAEVADSLLAGGFIVAEGTGSPPRIIDPDPLWSDALALAIRSDPVADDLRKLVRAREQQREDWIAWSIFWILASGVDGYVTAHLYDFPASIDVEPNRDGSVSVRLEVPLPGGRP